jgi:hypothetical protein
METEYTVTKDTSEEYREFQVETVYKNRHGAPARFHIESRIYSTEADDPLYQADSAEDALEKDQRRLDRSIRVKDKPENIEAGPRIANVIDVKRSVTEKRRVVQQFNYGDSN